MIFRYLSVTSCDASLWASVLMASSVWKDVTFLKHFVYMERGIIQNYASLCSDIMVWKGTWREVLILKGVPAMRWNSFLSFGGGNRIWHSGKRWKRLPYGLFVVFKQAIPPQHWIAAKLTFIHLKIKVERKARELWRFLLKVHLLKYLTQSSSANVDGACHYFCKTSNPSLI